MADNGRGFVSPNVTKGRITNVRTRYFREFMFNPTELDMDDGWNWGKHMIPGSSHAVLSGGHGADRVKTLNLYLDASRGRLEKRTHGDQDSRTLHFVNPDGPYDVSDEINFYRSFTYPSRAVRSNNLVDRGPARAILTLGALIPGVEVIIRTVHTKVVMFTPDLRPMRAEVQMTFEEFADRPRLASSLFFDPLDSEDSL
jgi:hypothetical protein